MFWSNRGAWHNIRGMGDCRINEKLSLMRQPPFDVADAWLIYGFEFVDVVNFFDFSEFYSICSGT